VLTPFRPIAAFSTQAKQFDFFYLKRQELALGEMGFQPGPKIGQPVTPLENALEYLPVDLYLKRIPNTEDALQLAAYLQAFFAKFDTDWRGINPVLPVSPLIIQGKRSRFHIDARRADNTSLLWLLLYGYRFGFSVLPRLLIAGIDFGRPEDTLESWWPAGTARMKEYPLE